MLPQKCEVALAPASEAKVITDEHPLRMHAFFKDVVNECLRTERREPRIEPRDLSDRYTIRAKEVELRAQRGQSRRRVIRREKLARMRLERHDRRRQPQVFGRFDETRQHRLVAAMDAVEVADRERNRLARRTREVALYPHAFSEAQAADSLARNRRGWARYPVGKARYFSAPPPFARGSPRVSNACSCQPPSTSGW